MNTSTLLMLQVVFFSPYTEVQEQALWTAQICMLYNTVPKSKQTPYE